MSYVCSYCLCRPYVISQEISCTMINKELSYLMKVLHVRYGELKQMNYVHNLDTFCIIGDIVTIWISISSLYKTLDNIEPVDVMGFMDTLKYLTLGITHSCKLADLCSYFLC